MTIQFFDISPMCLIPSQSLLGLLVDSFFRYPLEVIGAHSLLTSSFTVADMVLLLMPTLHRVITFTLITILLYFIFIFKNWRASSKSVFFCLFCPTMKSCHYQHTGFNEKLMKAADQLMYGEYFFRKPFCISTSNKKVRTA